MFLPPEEKRAIKNEIKSELERIFLILFLAGLSIPFIVLILELLFKRYFSLSETWQGVLFTTLVGIILFFIGRASKKS